MPSSALEMSPRDKYPKAPVRILDAIADYATNHKMHGGFVTACLENDLAEAVFRADSNSHGSKENVSAWLRTEGGNQYLSER